MFLLSSVFERSHTTQWADRGWYIVTEFERTPSINFTLAMELAATHPNHTPLMDERNILVYRNIYRPKELDLFMDIYRLIRRWKGAKLYIKGDRIDFDMLGGGIQCYLHTVLERPRGASLTEGCKMFRQETSTLAGCIGCRRSHVAMNRPESESATIPIWYAFGRLDQNQVYHIRSEDLESAVLSELMDYQYCPLLNIEEIQAFISALPTRIDPRKDREWRYNRQRERLRAPIVTSPQFDQRAAAEPQILPVSDDDYSAYLQRKHVLP